MQQNGKAGKQMDDNFVKGVGVGFMAVCTIGFFVLLFTGSSFGSDSGEAPTVKATNNAPTAPAPTAPAPTDVKINEVTADDHIYGAKDAKVTIVEFSDMQCPFCVKVHPTIKGVVDASDGAVNWAYRHLPLNSIHPNAQKYAEGSECVAELGGNEAFWEYLQAIFDTQPALTELAGVASQVGVSSSAFQNCLDSGKYAAEVAKDTADANGAGGRGTPFSVIIGPNGETVPVSGNLPAAQFQATIDSLLK